MHKAGAQGSTIREGEPRSRDTPPESSGPEDTDRGDEPSVQRTGVSPSGGDPGGPDSDSIPAGRHGGRHRGSAGNADTAGSRRQSNGTERNGTHPNDATHQQTDTPTDRQTNETNRKRRRRQEHNTEGKEGKEREETTTRDERKKAEKRSAKPPNRAEADRIGRVSNLIEPVRCAP